MADSEQLERLKQGVEAWNQWRRDNPAVQINLIGTNLSGANLSMANLILANLSGANLSIANLGGANLLEAKLSGANLRGISLIGGANLNRVDLKGADLIEADLRGANLIEANLNGANLSRANLSQIQAFHTDFTNAELTGACIEDRNFNSETKLDDVECDYIYLKYPDQERRPSDPNRNFEPGEFTKLFQKALNTFDLILHNGINWRAFAFAFNETNTKVIDEYGDRLFLRGYELLGDGMVKLKISYPEGTNRQKYQNLLEDNYELLKENKGLLKENVRRQVEDYENMLSLPKQVIVQIGANNSVDNRNINTGGGNYNESISGNYIQGNYINMSQDLTQAAAQIQELLIQLQKTGVTVETAQAQMATELATQAKSDPTVRGKLVGWGKTLANKAGETTVSEAVKAVVLMALKMLGIPL